MSDPVVHNYSYAIQVLGGQTAFVASALVGSTSWIGGAGGWEDITKDVTGEEDVVVEYGIVGTSPRDRTASAGSLSFATNNDHTNSAGIPGYYSPFHPLKRPGFDFNIPTRLVLNFDGVTTYKFYGSLAEIVPTVEEFQISRCRALDIFDDFARIDEPEISIQLDKRGDELLTALLDAISTQPVRRSFDIGVETFPVAFDGGTGQKLKLRERINQINLSEFGYCYPTGDTLGGGTVRLENRHHRASNPLVLFDISNADVMYDGSFAVAGNRADFYRNVVVSVHPINDLATTPVSVLYSLGTTQTFVAPGETNDTIFGLYFDPISKEKIGGVFTVDLVPYTDFIMNTKADGTGIDITYNFSVTSIRTASSVQFSVTNHGFAVSPPPADLPFGSGVAVGGYIRKLQQRGVPILRYKALLTESVTGIYGEQTLEYDMPLQSNLNTGGDVASYLARTLSLAYANLPPIRFLANRSAAHLHAAFEREPGDRIRINQDTTGLVNREYTINGVRLELSAEGLVWCTWNLEAATNIRFWLWGVPGVSEWGISTYYGF